MGRYNASYVRGHFSFRCPQIPEADGAQLPPGASLTGVPPGALLSSPIRIVRTLERFMLRQSRVVDANFVFCLFVGLRTATATPVPRVYCQYLD